MNAINRRDALRVSGITLAGGFIASLSPGHSIAQNVDQSVARLSATVASADLQAFAVNTIPQVVAKARNKSLSTQDCRELAGRIHLLGRHYAALNTTPLRMCVVSSLDASSGHDLSKMPEAQHAYATIARSIPDLSFAEFQRRITFSPVDLEAGRQSLAAHTLGWHFRSIANHIDALAYAPDIRDNRTAGPSSAAFTNATVRPQLSYPNYTRQTHAHLQSICNIGGYTITPQQLCQIVSGLTSLGFGLAALLAGAAPSSAVVASMAATLGLSVPLLIAFLAGIALIAGYYAIFC